MLRCRNNTCHSPDLYTRATGNALQHWVPRRRIAETEGIRSKVLQDREIRGADARAPRQRYQTRRCRRGGGGRVDRAAREDLLVETAKHEQLVLDYRATDGAAAEFVIAARRTGETIANQWLTRQARCAPRLVGVALGIAQSIQEVAVFRTIQASMPGVAALLGDDVDYRTRVAPILRAKLVGDKHVLLNEFRVAYEQARAADAVVIVVLAIDFLVIVAAAQPVAGNTGAVGVRKVVAAARCYTGNKQRHAVQAFVLLNAGKTVQHDPAEGVGDLRLRCVNQGRSGGDFHCGGGLTDCQTDCSETGVSAGRYTCALAYAGLETFRRDF